MSNFNKALIGVLVVVALVVGIVIATTSNDNAPDNDPDTGNVSINYGQDVFDSGVQVGDTTENWVEKTLLNGDNNGGWQNTLGRTVVVDYAELVSSGTASTTFTFDVATSTTENITNYTSPFSELIDSKQVSTSTAPIVVNSIKDSGTNGRGAVLVGDGEWVSVLISAGEPAQTGAPSCDGSVCETATSTNRGLGDVKLRLHYHFTGDN